jgi:hypothetical protein
MRWFRLGRGARQVQHDPGRRQAVLDTVRQSYGAHVRVPFAEQCDAVVLLLDGDDGLSVAAEIIGEVADAGHADLLAQVADLHRHTGRAFAVDRGNHRPLWEAAGPQLHWSLFTLPGGLHPYVQVTAAATVLAAQARRSVRVSDSHRLLAHVFEVLDLTLAGWEFGRVRVDVDAATLADRLISAARDLRAAMSDPPPLPSPVRELMRRNHTADVHDADGRVVGGFNPGRELRQSLLA